MSKRVHVVSINTSTPHGAAQHRTNTIAEANRRWRIHVPKHAWSCAPDPANVYNLLRSHGEQSHVNADRARVCACVCLSFTFICSNIVCCSRTHFSAAVVVVVVVVVASARIDWIRKATIRSSKMWSLSYVFICLFHSFHQSYKTAIACMQRNWKHTLTHREKESPTSGGTQNKRERNKNNKPYKQQQTYTWGQAQ